ncbi:MAG: carbohydrate ABC transporter [Myxococcales bacterium 68-20]|mgnify:FL=1|nr:ABC transporter ATP-binding protein [Myxococcales bacterium]OJY29270.1 MAG: carbohydrate ABC transporter [Myxococcales bacterium 68-20]
MSLDPGALPTTLGGQFKRHLGAYVAGGVMLGVFQLALNRIDWLSKAAIDDVFGGAPEQVTGPALWMFGLAVLAFASRVGSRWYIFNAGRDAEYELRALLLHRLHRLGTAFYRTMSAGEIMSRSSGDLQQVRLLLGFGVLNIVNVVFAFASALQVMATISVRLTLVSFVVLPVMVITTRTFSKQMFTRTRHNQETLGKLTEVLQTNLAGVRVVRSFALENREHRRFAAANAAYLDASLALARIRGLMFPMVGAASTLGVLAFFWYGASLLQRAPEAGGITRGEFFAFWLAYGRMTWPMIGLGFSISMIQRGRAGYVRLEEIFRALPEVTDGKLPHPKEVAGSISVRGLSFSYGDRKVVDDVSFEVPAGKSIALVGRTGSGKSTIAMLLARLLPTPARAVFVDGNDVCDLPLSAVRANVGYAQQDAFLFSTTVSRNVGFSLDECDSEEATRKIREAAREAQVLEEALGLPEQFDTVVGERGVQLSGGQKQRIALARALVREPKVLVLDDPLSAVDAKTEAAILDAIDRQAAQRTVILVTHRVAAAARCDAIVVLDEGRIIEQGTHDALVQNGGLYAAFAEEQSAKSELDDLEADAAQPGPVPA